MSTRRATVAALLAAVIAMALAGCGPGGPSNTSGSSGSPARSGGAGAPGAQPASSTNQADGVVVTVAISADRVVAGDRILIRLAALNLGLGPVTYEAGGCGPIMHLGVTGPPLPERGQIMPEGTGGAAILGLAKWSALSQGGTQLDWIRATDLPDDVPMACTADLRYEEIAPGETLTAEAVWIARIADGAPAPAGGYGVELAFPFVGRIARDELGAEPAITPIRVTVPFAVEPGPTVAVDAEAAIDAAIADPGLTDWAARRLTRETLSGATITMVGGRWRWRIEYQGGRTDVYVDPVTGGVTELRLGP